MELILLFTIVIVVLAFRVYAWVAGRGRGHRDDEDMKPCPHCAERIPPAARKCPFCRAEL